MATEYGIKVDGDIEWTDGIYQALEYAKVIPGASVVAREVSEPRIVSIRA